MSATVEQYDDTEVVEQLLGRPPLASFEVVLRSKSGLPVVIRNEPLTYAGLPMPTRWWLVGKEEVLQVSRLEAAGGVSQAGSDLDADAIHRAHLRYAAERDRAIPADWAGPRPTGGVGGTKRGIKCLHAHFAWWLAGGDDPVGEWVVAQMPSLARPR